MNTGPVDSTPIWRTAPRDRAQEETLVKELGIHPVSAALLVQRGYGDPEAATQFLSPSLDKMSRPEALPDYEKAKAEILGAKERGETIYIHGDYDVDGVTSTAIFSRFLEIIGCKVTSHVPHREQEGYGIHPEAVKAAKASGAKLFLTCDCGISANEQLSAVYEAGMRAVVTDHHEQSGQLPAAEAVVNPHRKDASGELHELCGAGIVFLLCSGIAEELNGSSKGFKEAYVDLAALGTVADIMPLRGNNRIIVANGLRALEQTKKIGLQALAQQAGIKKPYTTRTIGYQLGPRINAVGRIDDSDLALKLLTTKDPTEARSLAQILDQTNHERRAIEAESTQQATQMVLERNLAENYVIVVSDQGWNKGVIGLVAGRIAREFRRPTFALSVSGGIATGSARSLPGFHLAEAIERHRHILTKGGGHAMAAGISLDSTRIEEFATAIDGYAREFLSPEAFRPVVDVDIECAMEDTGLDLLDALRLLEPYGEANPVPVFATMGVQLTRTRSIKDGKYAGVTFASHGGVRSGISFNHAGGLLSLPLPSLMDVAYVVEEDTYAGRSVQWNLTDYRVNCESS